MIIALDGPAGSGKSTVAKAVAASLGFKYVDTGAMYRAITWRALEEKINLKDDVSLATMAEQSEITFIRHNDALYSVFLNGRDITSDIRSPQVTANVSAVSKVPAVRVALVKKQRAIRQSGEDLVIEGRDVGTVVFPDAELKIYLTASVKERAKRRHTELVEKGFEVSLESVERGLIERDKHDSTREASPLKKAPDAVLIDTTGKTVGEVVDEIAELARRVETDTRL